VLEKGLQLSVTVGGQSSLSKKGNSIGHQILNARMMMVVLELNTHTAGLGSLDLWSKLSTTRVIGTESSHHKAALRSPGEEKGNY